MSNHNLITTLEEADLLLACARSHNVLDTDDRGDYLLCLSAISKVAEENNLDPDASKDLARKHASVSAKYDENAFNADWESVCRCNVDRRMGLGVIINRLKERGVDWKAAVILDKDAKAFELFERWYEEGGDASTHPYFEKKGLPVPNYCPRVIRGGSIYLLGHTPDRQAAFIQVIDSEGNKKVITKMPPGSFIGEEITDETEWVIVVEGVADNSAIRGIFVKNEDTRIDEDRAAVLSAMNVGRLLGVVAAVRESSPEVRITVAVDNDNAGKKAAAKVAAAFPDVGFALPPVGKDFDDARMAGAEQKAYEALEAAEYKPSSDEKGDLAASPETGGGGKTRGRRRNATQEEHVLKLRDLIKQKQLRVSQDDYLRETRIELAGGEDAPLDPVQLTRVQRHLEREGLPGVKREMVNYALEDIADSMRYNSLTARVSQLPSPERYIDPANLFVDYMGAEDNEYSRAVGQLVMFGLIARALEPGCMFEFLPILYGEQGCGKTSFLRHLVLEPWDYGEMSFHTSEADRIRLSRGKHLLEKAEMKGFRAREVEEHKAYVSRRVDEHIRKYHEESTKYPRQYIMIGTTNERAILPEARNRRFPVLEVRQFDQAAFLRDKSDIWSSAKIFYEQEKDKPWEEQCGHVVEELWREREGDYREVDVWEEAIRSWIEGQTGLDQARGLITKEVAAGALKLDAGHVAPAHSRRIGQILRGLGYERKKVKWPASSGRQGTYEVWQTVGAVPGSLGSLSLHPFKKKCTRRQEDDMRT